MQRSYRSHLFAVGASLAVCFTAPAASAQPRSSNQPIMYIDIVVPFTLRHLHPSVISVFPSCKVGRAADGSNPPHWFTKKSSAVIGEDRVSYLTKEADGSYSGTLTERLAVEVPTTAAGVPVTVTGMPGTFMCQMGVKALGFGGTPILQHPPGMHSTSGPYGLAPNTPDRVEGQFTW